MKIILPYIHNLDNNHNYKLILTWRKSQGLIFPVFLLWWNITDMKLTTSTIFSVYCLVALSTFILSPSISRTLFFSNWNSVPIKPNPRSSPSLSLLSLWICLLLVPQISGVIQYSSFCDWQVLLFGSVIFLTSLDDCTLSFTLCLLSKNHQEEGIFEESFRGFIHCTRTLKFLIEVLLILKCICLRNSVWWPILSATSDPDVEYSDHPRVFPCAVHSQQLLPYPEDFPDPS